MSRTLAYAASCAALVFAGVAATWPFLDGVGRAGTLVAAAVALPLQVGAFAALRWGWDRRVRFMTVWVGGTLLRMAGLGGAVTLVVVSELPPAPTLLALAAFFFGTLLLEPLFLGRSGGALVERR